MGISLRKDPVGMRDLSPKKNTKFSNIIHEENPWQKLEERGKIPGPRPFQNIKFKTPKPQKYEKRFDHIIIILTGIIKIL